MRWLLITDPGLEAVTAGEVSESFPEADVRPEPYGLPGCVRVEIDEGR